jgi:hypothetical protein
MDVSLGQLDWYLGINQDFGALVLIGQKVMTGMRWQGQDIGIRWAR